MLKTSSQDALLKLIKFSDNDGFRRWLTDMVFALTYEAGEPGVAGHSEPG